MILIQGIIASLSWIPIFGSLTTSRPGGCLVVERSSENPVVPGVKWSMHLFKKPQSTSKLTSAFLKGA